jgi:UDP-N-acetylglucosamine 2-epimerase (non-hydrolysing)
MGNHPPLPRLGASARPLRVLVHLGTRPEAVKLAPVVRAAQSREDVEVRLVSSGQHPRRMLEVLDRFGIVPDVDLGTFHEGQTLAEVLRAALESFVPEIVAGRPDVVIVQGDTTSALAGALAAFGEKVPIAHVEAGLRTRDLARPYPEEVNRRLIDTFANFLFPPTPGAATNLSVEELRGADTFVTGNTIVDAAFALAALPDGDGPVLASLLEPNGYRGRILFTAHRRESWNGDLHAIAEGLKRAALRFPDHLFIAPLHPNPIVRASFDGGTPTNLIVREPLPYATFVKVLAASRAVVTDSGGVLEEAICFGKPAVVVREVSERPEAVDVGLATVAGVDSEAIASAIASVLVRTDEAPGPPSACVFGDGRAGERIIDWLRWRFGLSPVPPEPFLAPQGGKR